MGFPFLKGHGTGNDFVVLPDLDGGVHGDLDPELVRLLCDRRRGIGADGVLRVLRRCADGDGPEWFMDHRNADGSVSQMCGNGIRVFGHYLVEAGLVDPAGPVAVDTRDGVKTLEFDDQGEVSVDMGVPRVGAATVVSLAGHSLTATAVDVGNPNAVVQVTDPLDAGDLVEAPGLDADDFPDGANVEFVQRVAAGTLRMRVYERGVGETLSCGTGACAAAAAVKAADAVVGGASYVVEVPGGRLVVELAADGRARLRGPAVLVAEGVWIG